MGHTGAGFATFQFLLPSPDSVPTGWPLLLQVARSQKKDHKNSHFDVFKKLNPHLL